MRSHKASNTESLIQQEEGESYIHSENDLDKSIIENESGQQVQSTPFQAFFNMIEFLMGLGILSLSSGIKQTGFILGAFVIFIVVALCTYCMILIIDVADHTKNRNLTLSGLTRRVLGTRYETFVDICVLGIQFSLDLSYAVWLITFLSRVSCLYSRDSVVGGLCDQKLIFIGILLIVVIPLCLITNLHYFYYVSLLSFIIQVTDYIAIYIYNINIMVTTDILDESLAKKPDYNSIFYLFGVVVFAVEGIPATLNVRRSMQSPYKFKKIINPIMIFTGILYASFASISYLAHGKHTESSVLFNLPLQDPKYSWIAYSYGLAIIFSFALQITIAFKILEKFTWIRQFVSWSNDITIIQPTKYTQIRRFIFRILVILLLMIIAYVSPSFNVIISFSGSFFFTIIGFIIPPFLYNTYFSNTITKSRLYFNYFVLVFGCILGAFGIKNSFEEMVEEFKNK